MKKFVLIIPFLFLTALANNAAYFPADIEKAKASIMDILVPFKSEPVDISMYTRQPMSGVNSVNQPISIAAGSQIILPTNLDQIYESFKRTMETESLFSRNGKLETMTMENPEEVRIKSALMELIQLKMQERAMEQFEEQEASKAQREMIEVRVKKEGEVEKKVKIAAKTLQDAVEKESVVVQEDEVVSPRLSSDYDGSDNWAVKQNTESGVCLFCDHKKDNVAAKLERDTVNAFIQSKYEKYSKDKQTAKMIEFAKKNRRSDQEYKQSLLKWCYRYVKNALDHAKLTSKRLEGVLPRNAGDKLKAEGFVNIMEDPDLVGKIKDPSQAPKGALLVYEPNPITRLSRSLNDAKDKSILAPDAGHIEIKTEDVGKGGYVSDYYSLNARTGTGLVSEDRKLIGIYVKK
tara:strand:+ start:32576 stop:33790 length:1215 start_codon:yes stop_codon:yes gene_type:complete